MADLHRQLPHDFSKWLILIDAWKMQMPLSLPIKRGAR